MFNASQTKNDIVEWIRGFFNENGRGCPAVIGISGGKDSSIAAALCVEALGRANVVGVLMPNGEQHDIDTSKELVDYLEITRYIVNIKECVDTLTASIRAAGAELNSVAVINVPARIRMTTLYAISATLNGRVVNTCNLSESRVGYSTKYGDNAGDFSPLSRLTATEVKEEAERSACRQNL